MPASPWLTLKQAREAVRAGRPDEARRLLDPLAADGYRPASRLQPEVAAALFRRAERHLRADAVDAAWADLRTGETLAPAHPAALRLRHVLTRLGLAECRAALEAGRPAAALDAADRLVSRGGRTPELDALRESAGDWLTAVEQADRGDFRLADITAGRARERLEPPASDGLDRFRADLATRADRFRTALGPLDAAAGGGRWRETVRWAEEVIAAAPAHQPARRLRADAWSAMRPTLGQTQAYTPLDQPVPLAVAAPEPPPASRSGPGGLPKRFLLWVDGVGGYLVCLNPRVTFGQAVAGGPVDVPLFAELARLHAELSRDAEGYVIETARDVWVNGAAAGRAVLRPGDRVTLGGRCQFVFHRPVAISLSARLELVSGHRLPLAVDGVLLMADQLVLGPGSQAHVPLPVDLLQSVVLYHGRDGLGVRCPGGFRIDGRPCQDRAELPLPAVVTGDRFQFAVEPVGSRL
jgi:hypothetical protein